MLLNMDILALYLSKIYRIRKYGPECTSLSLSHPFVYLPGDSFVQGRLYVVGPQSLPKVPPAEPVSFVYVGVKLPTIWSTSGLSVLQVLDSVDSLRVFSQIQECFDMYESWDHTIRDEIEKQDDFDLKRIIEVGVQMLKNPICVSNQSLQLLVTSDIHWNADGTFHVHVDDIPKPFPIDGLDNIKEFGRMEKQLRRPYLTAAKVLEPPESHKTYCNNLYLMDHFAGCIYLRETCHRFQATDYLLADYFFAYFQKAFAKYLQRNRNFETPQNTALRHLLDGNRLSAEEQELFSLSRGERWYCFKLRERRESHYMPKDYMYAILNTMMPDNVYAVIRNQEIMGVLRAHSEGTPGECSSILLFRELLDRMEYTAGLSNTFTAIGDFCHYLPQAVYAADKPLYGEEMQTLQFFETQILQYLLSSCTNEFPLRTLFSEPFRTLLEHDQQKGTEYLHTLDIYLKNEMNMTRSADALFIHRTSLLKRLERIEQLVGPVLEDEAQRLYFRICFHLLEQERQ